MADAQRLWAIVLAGGEGVRLRPLVRRMLGEERPKQFVKLLGPRSLLRQTLDRVALGISPDRTVVVTVRPHIGYMAEEFTGDPRPPYVLAQPEDRGTAAAILYAAQWIAVAAAPGAASVRVWQITSGVRRPPAVRPPPERANVDYPLKQRTKKLIRNLTLRKSSAPGDSPLRSTRVAIDECPPGRALCGARSLHRVASRWRMDKLRTGDVGAMSPRTC